MAQTRRLLDLLVAISLSSFVSAGCALDAGAEDALEESELEEAEHHGGSSKDPIIFVHGCTPPDATDPQALGLWEPMKQQMRAAGYPENYLVNFLNTGPQCQSSITFANNLKNLVQQTRQATGRYKVDIVAHSMGALATRWYIAFLGGSYYVDDVVSIVGGNHGGAAAAAGVQLQAAFGYPAFEGMQEMFPPYACRGQSSGQPTADVQYNLNGCLTPTGRTVWRDETPGHDVDYLAIYNTLDEIVVPAQAACLNQSRQNDCSSWVNVRVTVGPSQGPCGPPGTVCLGHVAVLWDPGVIARTIQATSDAWGYGGGDDDDDDDDDD